MVLGGSVMGLLSLSPPDTAQDASQAVVGIEGPLTVTLQLGCPPILWPLQVIIIIMEKSRLPFLSSHAVV